MEESISPTQITTKSQSPIHTVLTKMLIDQRNKRKLEIGVLHTWYLILDKRQEYNIKITLIKGKAGNYQPFCKEWFRYHFLNTQKQLKWLKIQCKIRTIKFLQRRTVKHSVIWITKKDLMIHLHSSQKQKITIRSN